MIERSLISSCSGAGRLTLTIRDQFAAPTAGFFLPDHDPPFSFRPTATVHC
ncbi:MAG TPA: hypothetical protein VI547_10925 [Anaerolineales bacterium]|nr:hypothetical protein [Anaerolineales bacterium]